MTHRADQDRLHDPINELDHHEDVGSHADGRKERACALTHLSRGRKCEHRAAPPPAAGSDTVRAKRAACAEPAFT